MIEKLNYPHLGIIVLAWLAADLLTPVLGVLARRLGLVDKPGGYKQHTKPTPYLGGLAILLAFSLAIFSTLRFESFERNLPLFGIVFGATFVVALGLVDDLRPLSAVFKLAALLGATAVLYHFGIRTRLMPFEWADFLLTLLWLAGVTSAFNSLDNMDGVAVGISGVAACAVFLICWENYLLFEKGPGRDVQRQVSFLSAGVLGATLGFIRYNFPPARIFLGDNGSFLVGFLLASMALLGGWSSNDPLRSLLVPCCVLVVPLFDITLCTVLRLKNRVVGSIRHAIAYCGRDHVSHRLMALGFSKRETVFLLYLFAAVGGAVGYYVSRPEPIVGRASYLTVSAIGLALLVVLGVILDRAPVYESHQQGCDGSLAGAGSQCGPAATKSPANFGCLDRLGTGSRNPDCGLPCKRSAISEMRNPKLAANLGEGFQESRAKNQDSAEQ